MDSLEQARSTINDIDAQIAQLFVRRMQAVDQVARCKKAAGLPVFDAAREAQVLAAGANYMPDQELSAYFAQVQRTIMDVSKQHQRACLDALPAGVVVERGGLARVGELFNVNRRALVVTDFGVPRTYVRAVAQQCGRAVMFALPAGEGSKSVHLLTQLLETMLEEGFTRDDCVVAVGGGVVSDVAGFAAATYMRGIDFYTVPTTLLAQVDASVGGKTAINLGGYKNMVGAFHMPRGVLIDPNVLETLPERHWANGFAEAVKIALTCDEALFELFEGGCAREAIDRIITRAICAKARIVERDEREQGLRRVLNFGHTFGHALEACSAGALLHGEAVALGMIPFCAPDVRARLVPVLRALDLPVTSSFDEQAVQDALLHDKKTSADGAISVVRVPQVGAYEFASMMPGQAHDLLACIAAAEPGRKEA